MTALIGRVHTLLAVSVLFGGLNGALFGASLRWEWHIGWQIFTGANAAAGVLWALMVLTVLIYLNRISRQLGDRAALNKIVELKNKSKSPKRGK